MVMHHSINFEIKRHRTHLGILIETQNSRVFSSSAMLYGRSEYFGLEVLDLESESILNAMVNRCLLVRISGCMKPRDFPRPRSTNIWLSRKTRLYYYFQVWIARRLILKGSSI